MSDINVIQRSQHIIVDPASTSVSITNAGPIGPGGPQGVGTTAVGTSIDDAGNHFTTDNVEDTLQVIAGQIDARDASIVDHETRIGQAEVKMADNDQRIATNHSDINDHQVLLTALGSELGDVETRLQAEEQTTTNQQTELDEHDAKLTANESTLSMHIDAINVVEQALALLDSLVHDHINSQALLNTSILNDITSIQSRLDALENP